MTAPLPCTPVGARYRRRCCTPVGATSLSYVAPFFVQHRSAELVPPSVQDTLHPRWFNNENPHLLTKPVMHGVQDGRNPYRTFRLLPFEYPTTNATPDRVRGEKAEADV